MYCWHNHSDSSSMKHFAEVIGTVEFKNGSKWTGSFAGRATLHPYGCCVKSSTDLLPHGFVVVTSPSGLVEEHFYEMGKYLRCMFSVVHLLTCRSNSPFGRENQAIGA